MMGRQQATSSPAPIWFLQKISDNSWYPQFGPDFSKRQSRPFSRSKLHNFCLYLYFYFFFFFFQLDRFYILNTNSQVCFFLPSLFSVWSGSYTEVFPFPGMLFHHSLFPASVCPDDGSQADFTHSHSLTHSEPLWNCLVALFQLMLGSPLFKLHALYPQVTTDIFWSAWSRCSLDLQTALCLPKVWRPWCSYILGKVA